MKILIGLITIAIVTIVHKGKNVTLVGLIKKLMDKNKLEIIDETR